MPIVMSNDIFRVYKDLQFILRLSCIIIGLIYCNSSIAQFQPPIGVPDPGHVWSTQDNVTWDPMDDTATTLYGNAGYKSSTDGPYTHYVDKDHANCNDSGPATKETPLCNIPNNISAGQIIEVHASAGELVTGYPGCYFKGDVVIHFDGTSTKPAILNFFNSGFCSESNKDLLEFRGDNFIVDGMNSLGMRVFLGEKGNSNPSVDHHGVIRNSTISWVGGTCLSLRGYNQVAYKVNVHHCLGDDTHGFFVGTLADGLPDRSSKYIWILDGSSYMNGGNGLQFCNRCGEDAPQFIWIARNRFHNNKETGAGFKYSKKILLSQNEFFENRYPGVKGAVYTMPDAISNSNLYQIYNFSSSATNGSAGDGSGTIIGADGVGDKYYIIGNYYHDNGAVGPDGIKKGRNIRIEDNQLTYIAQNISTTSVSDVFAVDKGMSKGSIICNNTFVDKDGSKTIYWGYRDAIHINWRNNIVVGVNAELLLDVPQSGVTDKAVMTHNIWWDTTGTMRYTWRNTNQQSLSSSSALNNLVTSTGTISNNIFQSPSFNNFSAGDYSLNSSTSPARGTGTDCMSEIESAYRFDFGPYATTLMRDYSGNIMPTTNVDMGALQTGSASPTSNANKPPPPSGFGVIDIIAN